MSSTCRPWYKWFPKDFMADEKVRALSPLAELVYRRILDALWESSECRLPNDIRFLHRVSCKDISYEQFIEVWNEVQYPGFEILKNTEKFVWSKRLKVQFVECVERSEKARKSALAMHSKKANAERTQSERKQNAHADKDIDKDIKKNNNKKKVIFGEFKNVFLTNKEFEKLKASFGEAGANQRIENLSSYVASKGKKYKSHYATILTWERKNKKPKRNQDSVYFD